MQRTSHVPYRLWAGATSVFAWAMLWVWSRSDFGIYLSHADWTAAAQRATACRISTGSPSDWLITALAWLLMSIAMMLPVATPFFAMSLRAGPTHAETWALLAWLVPGYLLPWMLFGAVLHLPEYAIGIAAQQVDVLVVHGWMIGAALMSGTAAFQLSPYKAKLMRRMGQVEQTAAQAIANGASGARIAAGAANYGTLCAACCGPLMSLMFVFWSGSLLWSLFLGLLMVCERKRVLGLPMSRLIGWGLLVATVGIAERHL